MKHNYRVRYIQRLVLYEFEIKAHNEEEADQLCYKMVNKYDRDIIDKTEIEDLDE